MSKTSKNPMDGTWVDLDLYKADYEAAPLYEGVNADISSMSVVVECYSEDEGGERRKSTKEKNDKVKRFFENFVY